MAAKHTDLLRQFGLSRNPFVDRTAEKTELDDVALYVHSDLQGFKPSETTYVFFGRRGSGKTTIRLQMQAAYHTHNLEQRETGHSRGFYVVDLSEPGHLTACLRNFQDAIGSTDDDWNASFAESWTCSDMVDCILSYALTDIVARMTDPSSVEGQDMLDRVAHDPRAARQLLLLAHLYATTDSASLGALKAALLRPGWSSLQLGAAAGGATLVLGGAALAAASPAVATSLAAPAARGAALLELAAPPLAERPRLALAAAAALAVAGTYYYRSYKRQRSLERAAALARDVRVARHRPAGVLAALIDSLFPLSEQAETIRALCIGVSAHQKLSLLNGLLRLLGYESLAVFGDCFDEVVLLDPVQYPGAIKVFAREVCRNDLLNFGRCHFFFPDSRLALDLSTDKTLKEARFDRHFVRDLTWSRHQLEELAERRFLSAQLAAQRRAAAAAAAADADGLARVDVAAAAAPAKTYAFADLFKAVRMEDFSSYLSKLATPRELMIMMMSRMEAHPDGGLTAQDMEIATSRALEQAV